MTSTSVIANDSATMSTPVERNAMAHEYSSMAQLEDIELQIAEHSSSKNYQNYETKYSASHYNNWTGQENEW